MKLLYTCIFLLSFTVLSAQHHEAWYVDKLNRNYFHGETEVVLHGGRADIVNRDYAIEVEFADNWKESVGQALWYGLQSNKKPGIVLIMRDKNDWKYGIMLQSALNYAEIGDKIKLWFYPRDFKR